MSETAVLPTPIMDRLRNETRAAHDDVEAVPFSRAIVEQTLPRNLFIVHLAAMHRVHEALEAALQYASDPAVAAIWRDDLAKAPLLKRDLAALQWSADAGETAAAGAAAAWIAEIQRDAATSPWALLGSLYVLEGSTLGATILRKHLASMYDLDASNGLAYYSPYGDAVMPHWQQFKARMNSLELSAQQQDDIVQAGRRAFGHVGAILAAVMQQQDSATT